MQLLDLRDFPIPFFDEVAAPSQAPVASPVARAWSDAIGQFDGYVLVVAEYNRSFTAVLKNALDHLHLEAARKPAAFLGYGGSGGMAAVQHLRTVVGELSMIPLRNAIHIGTEPYLAVRGGKAGLDDFPSVCGAADRMLGELETWVRKHRFNRMVD